MAKEASGDLKDDIPKLGLRSYWYPAMKSKWVGNKARSLRLLGEDVVLFRSNESIHALAGKCPHRGMPLWLGESRFPGTLSCAYHGWTFDGTGQCVAILLEGPASTLPPKVRIHSYPVAERNGLIWIYVGELDPPALEEDLPPALLKPDAVTLTDVQDWSCNWRAVVESFMDPLHTLYLHRNSLSLLLEPVLSSGRLNVKEIEDGKGFRLRYQGDSYQDVYPGLGKFPRRLWWQKRAGFHSGRDEFWEQEFFLDVRLPSYVSVNLPGGVTFIQWAVPIDEKRTRCFAITVIEAGGLRTITAKLWYYLYFHWAHNRLPWSILGQDRWVAEHQDYQSPEKLSVTDEGIIRWRRLAALRARGATTIPAGAVPADS